jgi:hypothetical protein
VHLLARRGADAGDGSMIVSAPRTARPEL